MLAKEPDYKPYSDEIDVHGDTEGPLESGGKLEPDFVGALVEAVSKCDLFVIVSRQKSYLVSEEIGREIMSDLRSNVSDSGFRVGELTLWSSPAKARAV